MLEVAFDRREVCPRVDVRAIADHRFGRRREKARVGQEIPLQRAARFLRTRLASRCRLATCELHLALHFFRAPSMVIDL